MTARIKRMKPFRVTARWLRDRLACAPQRELFRELFGTEVLVTEKIIRKYYSKFAWMWLIQRKFSYEATWLLENAYRPHVEKYRVAVDKIYKSQRYTRNGNVRPEFDWIQYNKACASIRRVRDSGKKKALIEVLRQLSPE